MTSVLKLDYKVVPSQSTETYIELAFIFEVNKHNDYISCFNSLTDDVINQHLSIIDHTENTVKYLYFGYLENCNTVLGVIEDIKELQNNIKPKSMFDIECRIYRLIKTLIGFWH
jgi:hypothetical protein